MDSASPPVSPRVVARILIIQKTSVTSGTLLRPSFVAVYKRFLRDALHLFCCGSSVSHHIEKKQHPSVGLRCKTHCSCLSLRAFSPIVLARKESEMQHCVSLDRRGPPSTTWPTQANTKSCYAHSETC